MGSTLFCILCLLPCGAGALRAVGPSLARSRPAARLARSAADPRAGLSDVAAARSQLLSAIARFNAARDRDGSVSIDFGVKGGELDKETRAPRNLAESGAFYAVSAAEGQAADEVIACIDTIAPLSPTPDATRFFGTREGALCPLHGSWRNIFTTAADATFSKNSTRGDALVSNTVNAVAGTITNCIDFLPKEGVVGPPNPEQLRVQLAATAESKVRISLVFRKIKVRLNKLPLLPLFGKRVTLTLPVPGPFLTRILFFFRRGPKLPPAYFDVLYLDDDLRVHKTGQGALFVQQRPPWG